MAENSKIEWCHHTFNPWIGCTKVGPGCDHCYAETQDNHRKWTPDGWGAGNPRKRTSESNWKLPLRWNKKAEKEGVRYRVFCSSLADVFDNEVPEIWRDELISLIEDTPNLDWLLLTKRIGNVEKMLPRHWRKSLPKHVWPGITVVNQEEADRDILKLFQIPAHVRWLSMEPLIEGVDIKKWLSPWTCSNCGFHGCQDDSGDSRCDECDTETVSDDNGEFKCPSCNEYEDDESISQTCPNCGIANGWSMDLGFKFPSRGGMNLIDWVVVGGESGPGARPMHPDWVRSLRDQCINAGVKFLFKQWGEWFPGSDPGPENADYKITYGKGHFFSDGQWMDRIGKSKAGRELDSKTWDEYPEKIA